MPSYCKATYGLLRGNAALLEPALADLEEILRRCVAEPS